MALRPMGAGFPVSWVLPSNLNRDFWPLKVHTTQQFFKPGIRPQRIHHRFNFESNQVRIVLLIGLF